MSQRVYDTIPEMPAVTLDDVTAEGLRLDAEGQRYGVARLPGEDDFRFRDRIQNAARVARASLHVQAGEQFVPVPVLEQLGEMLLVRWTVEWDEQKLGKTCRVRREFYSEEDARQFASAIGQGRITREERLP